MGFNSAFKGLMACKRTTLITEINQHVKDLLYYNQRRLIHVSATYCGHLQVFFEGILHRMLKQFTNTKC